MAAVTARQCQQWSDHFDSQPAQEMLAWALSRFHPALALASSFGAEDMVLLDMLSRIGPRVRVFTLDTGRLPQETYDLMEIARARYGPIEVYAPEASEVEAMVGAHGPNLFYRSVELRKLCCAVRKVQPLRRALAGLDAWIAGLRREQGPTRAAVAKVEMDSANGGLVKVNPLADWTWEDVWRYIREHDVPYNALHDRGYPSIGCAPCTRAVQPGEDPRAGRWWWEQVTAKECGLHPEAAR
jgi:thioredoxin-dependent adenylylsulfate APS reductase